MKCYRTKYSVFDIYIYNGIGNVKQFERVSVCFSKKKKKKSIARLKKTRETFFRIIFSRIEKIPVEGNLRILIIKIFSLLLHVV